MSTAHQTPAPLFGSFSVKVPGARISHEVRALPRLSGPILPAQTLCGKALDTWTMNTGSARPCKKCEAAK